MFSFEWILLALYSAIFNQVYWCASDATHDEATVLQIRVESDFHPNDGSGDRKPRVFRHIFAFGQRNFVAIVFVVTIDLLGLAWAGLKLNFRSRKVIQVLMQEQQQLSERPFNQSQNQTAQVQFRNQTRVCTAKTSQQ
jgi:hypothetical protein